MKKGNFGYLAWKKRSQLIKTMIAFFISFTVFLLGYWLNNNSKQNIFTIISVLIILPAARLLVGYIVVAPFRSVSKKRFDEVAAKKEENDELFVDLVFTSNEKIMNLSFLMLRKDCIIGLSEHKKADVKYIKEYLQRLIDGRQLPYQVQIVQDYSAFLKDLEIDNYSKDDLNNREEVHKIIMSILV
jgi:flagellar motor component MotA